MGEHARIYDLVDEATGVAYKLNENRGLSDFISNVSGVGYSYDGSYENVGNDYYLASKVLKQGTFSGTVYFTNPKPYERYQRFLQFIQGKELALMYRPTKVWYKKYGRVLEADKTEPGSNGLKCSVTFYPRTQWLKNLNVSGADSVMINSESYLSSKCHVEITGTEAIENPYWTQTVNGMEYIVGRIKGKLNAGETLHIRTDTFPYSIYKTDTTGAATDLYALSDFATERFITIEHGENVISCDGASFINVSGYIEYESV